MSEYTFEVARTITAPSAKLHAIVADYRVGHPSILPRPPFGELVVEEGGIGAGTVIRFELKLGGKWHTTRVRITEPQPGVQLDESDLAGNFVTSYFFESLSPAETRLTIRTVARTRAGGIAGWLERLFTPRLLKPVYERELDLLTAKVR
ncbi:MAG: SRPBCC family protein [Candidatus Didemnitutus sp.]|nr:SRPBCC family protein [Candidatus Didemnitutus sp.]